MKSKRPLVFLSVGIVNTLLDFGFYTLLTGVFFEQESQIAIAGLISGTFALLIAFLTHGLITWRGAHLSRQALIRFFIFTGFGMWVIRPLLLSLFIKLSGVYRAADQLLDKVGVNFSYDFVANTGAFGLMLAILLVYNYVVYERYVFTKSTTDRTGPENH